MVRVVRENASGIRVIKALSKTEYEKERFKAANQNIVEKETKASVTMAASNPLMNLFLNAGLTLVVVAGAFRVAAGQTQTGTILAFLTYFTIILNAMLSINRMFMLFSKGSASANRISQVLTLRRTCCWKPGIIRIRNIMSCSTTYLSPTIWDVPR